MKNLQFSHLFLFQEELDTLRAKLEKVEKERTEYKQTAEKLEGRVSARKKYSL